MVEAGEAAQLLRQATQLVFAQVNPHQMAQAAELGLGGRHRGHTPSLHSHQTRAPHTHSRNVPEESHGHHTESVLT